MKTDCVLHDKLKKPLNSIKSGVLIGICGAAGSGKSCLVINLLTKKKENKEKMGLYKCFNEIFIVSPSMKSFNNDIFESVDATFKYDNLLDFLNNYEEQLIEEDDEYLIIFDDIGSQIRTQQCMVAFNKLIHNRRHKHMTIILLVQNLTMIPPAIRDSINMLICFKPKTLVERELIYDYTGLHKKYLIPFYKYMFQEKHDSMLIDMTLNHSSDYEFYRNIFNKITFNMKD